MILCVCTNWLHWEGVHYAGPYLAVWTVGLGTWAAIFWGLRRRAGPVTFVERQIAHIWGASIICCVGLYFVEMLLGLEVLRLTPLLGLFSGTVFFTKASILTGKFYVQAGVLYLSVVPMALYPDVGLTIFGVVSAFCFAVPGFRYWRQRGRRWWTWRSSLYRISPISTTSIRSNGRPVSACGTCVRSTSSAIRTW